MTRIRNNSYDEVVCYLVRHGETMFNTLDRAQGWSDTPLTAAGIEAIRCLGRGLEAIDFHQAYSSDAGRARQTAKIILAKNKQQNVQLIESENFREACFGIYEGTSAEKMFNNAAKRLGHDSFTEIIKNRPYDALAQLLAAIVEMDSSHQAEDMPTVSARMKKQLLEIAKDASKQGDGNILIVSHGISIKCLLSGLVEKLEPHGQLQNGSVTKVVFRNDTFIIEEIGSMEYMKMGNAVLA